ncbi:MAG: phenylalanine 4-monooxygenase [Acidimicrobiales bacterium]
MTLPPGHPGRDDPDYRRRRVAIAEAARRYVPGEPIPDVAYTPAEDGLWRLVSAELSDQHRRHACAEYLEAARRLVLPTDRVPQLAEVDRRLAELTGFRLVPVDGLVPARRFYGALAERTFLSTQYVRHHSTPRYTPEPDIVHEIVGHATMLASERFADLCEAAGRASLRAATDDALRRFSAVFWFTLEFGVLVEDGSVKAYGAGLLSSFGELDAFTGAELRRFDPEAMADQPYDITAYQPVLFAAPSWRHLEGALGDYFEQFGT